PKSSVSGDAGGQLQIQEVKQRNILRTSGQQRQSLLQLERADVSQRLDPRLQHVVERAARGYRNKPTSSTRRGEVPVIARVRELGALKARTDFLMGAVLGATSDGTLVTGRIPVTRVEAIRGDPNVLSLKAAQRVSRALE